MASTSNNEGTESSQKNTAKISAPHAEVKQVNLFRKGLLSFKSTMPEKVDVNFNFPKFNTVPFASLACIVGSAFFVGYLTKELLEEKKKLKEEGKKEGSSEKKKDEEKSSESR